MPLFRFHKDALDESLATTIIVKDEYGLRKIIHLELQSWFHSPVSLDFIMEIEPYPTIDLMFDKRCGWYTHIVTVHVHNTEIFPIGYLSEPLN